MKKLETPRLILRRWQEHDVSDLFNIMKNSTVVMGGWNPHPNVTVSAGVLNEYIESDNRWAIELRDEKR